MKQANQNLKTFVFVYLSINNNYNGISQGIAFLVPIIKKFGFKVETIDLLDNISARKFRKMILDKQPLVVCFCCIATQFRYLYKYLKAIGNIPNLIQIAGGSGPSLSAEDILTNSNVDGIFIGEAEKSVEQFLINLTTNKSIYTTPGFYWMENGQVKKNKLLPLIEDLSELAFPDYSDFPKSLIFYKQDSFAIQLSRGCPYSCSYCCNPALRQQTTSSVWFRVPPVDYSIQLLKNIIGQYPEIKSFNFNDELLISDKKWLLEFCKAYQREINLPYAIFVRTEKIDQDVVNALAESNCHTACIGLESGDEILRKTVAGRGYSNKEFIKKCQLVKEAGIKIFTFNIVGFPGETIDQMKKTLELNKMIKSDGGNCSFFYPFPKTRLYNLCQDQDLLLDNKQIIKITNYITKPCIKMSWKNRKQCIKMQQQILKYLKFDEFNLSKSYNKYFKVVNRLIGKVGIFLKSSFPSVYFVFKKFLNNKLA